MAVASHEELEAFLIETEKTLRSPNATRADFSELRVVARKNSKSWAHSPTFRLYSAALMVLVKPDADSLHNANKMRMVARGLAGEYTVAVEAAIADLLIEALERIVIFDVESLANELIVAYHLAINVTERYRRTLRG